ncbi:MAG: polyprenol monophosphomannose synthase [Cytophagales bacterium]|nr:polyprenol monophosphomannose synthase [Cytophagales bacterium]
MDNKYLVIIPTYNEIQNIEAVCARVFSLPSHFHILVVDDGSPDGTAQKVMELQTLYGDKLQLAQRAQKSGLGTAYIHGFKYALQQGYEYIFEMDCDFSHNPEDLEKLLYTCQNEGYDVCVGSRYVNNLINVVNWPIERVLLSFFASKYVKFITGMPIFDSTAGFICYHHKVLKTMILDDIRFVGYGFQIETKFNAWKYGFNIKEIPIIFTDRAAGESKMSKNIIWEAIFGVIKLKIYSYFGDYKVHNT